MSQKNVEYWCHKRMLNIDVTKECWTLMSQNNVEYWCHKIMLNIDVTKECWTLMSQKNVEYWCHKRMLNIDVAKECWILMSQKNVEYWCHKIMLNIDVTKTMLNIDITKVHVILIGYWRIQCFGTEFFGRNLITELARWSIRPNNEVPKHSMSSITELLYTSIKLSVSVNKSFCVGFVIIIKCFEHQFIPKHSA